MRQYEGQSRMSLGSGTSLHPTRYQARIANAAASSLLIRCTTSRLQSALRAPLAGATLSRGMRPTKLWIGRTSRFFNAYQLGRTARFSGLLLHAFLIPPTSEKTNARPIVSNRCISRKIAAHSLFFGFIGRSTDNGVVVHATSLPARNRRSSLLTHRNGRLGGSSRQAT